MMFNTRLVTLLDAIHTKRVLLNQINYLVVLLTVNTTTDSTQPMHDLVTRAYCHLLADVNLAGFAPAFTLSFHDSECSRKPPMPIASVVTKHAKKRKDDRHEHKLMHIISVSKHSRD